jgi:hypothetical protein
MDLTLENCHTVYEDFLIKEGMTEASQKIDKSICELCAIEKIIVEDGFYCCPECGLMDIDNPVTVKEFSEDYMPKAALYKRRLYAMEKMKLITGHKTCRSYHYNKIVKELKEYDINTLVELKDYLKQLKLHKYYKYIYNIYFDLTGIRLITLSIQDMDFLSRKFVELESKFKASELHKRSNIFNYNSILYILMKKYKYKGYKNLLLPLNHLKISTVIKKLL